MEKTYNMGQEIKDKNDILIYVHYPDDMGKDDIHKHFNNLEKLIKNEEK